MTALPWVEAAAGALALWAAWKTLPRPPALDWERLFKVSLATVLRGEVERARGEVEDWEALLDGVLFHPHARDVDRRLRDPASSPIPTPPRDGERATVDRLAALPTPEARFAHLFAEDPRGRASLLDDPALLGAAYDPTARFGPQATWDSVADWSESLQAGLLRRLQHVVVVDGTAALGPLVPTVLPGLRHASVGSPAQLSEAMTAHLPAPADRLVLLLDGPQVEPLLQALAADPALLDRLLVVVSLGGTLISDRAVWEQHFRHAALEPELQRTILFASLVHVNRDDPLATTWSSQTFAEPPVPDTGRRSIACADLGGLDRGQVAPEALLKALLVFLATAVSV